MASDSDSDDNIPLAQLKAAVKAEPRVKAEPKPTIKRQGSDSDDDIPISKLGAKKIKIETTITPAVRSSTRASPRTPQKKKRMKIKFKQQECTEELYGTLKGRLVQELLCRWWYVIEWPLAISSDVSSTLPGMQELDGFRGSYIRVKGEDMGSIVDTRPQLGKPSFMHFMAMPSVELQKLLVKAYEKQMEVLKEHEGPNAPLLKDLKTAMGSAAKISTDKADKSVIKVLKKYKELADKVTELQAKMAQGENTGTDDDETGEDNAEDDDDDEEEEEVGGGGDDEDEQEEADDDDDDDE